jgi:beta-glucosidase
LQWKSRPENDKEKSKKKEKAYSDMMLFLIFLVINLSSTLTYSTTDWNDEIRWNWADIENIDDLCWKNMQISFPREFLWGVSTWGFKIEGTVMANGRHCENSWTHYKLAQPGIACDHWDRYKEDVQLIKNLGMNSYRFSIEWSKIEPQKGVFDKDSMQHYVDLVDELIANDIEPIPCLLHHAWPIWWDKKGAFEKAENIQDFVEFADYVFEKLNKKVSMWMTINEPVGYAFEGYFRGKYPPFKENLALCGTVVKNMLNAHVAIAKLFKSKNPKVKIGFPKVFQPLDPYNRWNPLDMIVCKIFNYLLHDVALNFFKTGHFDWLYMVTDYNSDAPESLDYLGVNYYSHSIISNFKTTYRSTETIMGEKALYPEGLYRSLQKAAELGVPLYIAENGVRDEHDLWKNDFIVRHLIVVKKALEKGIDVRGYFIWTLLDECYEGGGKMGLYRVDPITKDRTLYEGAKPFVSFVRSFKDNDQLYQECPIEKTDQKTTKKKAKRKKKYALLLAIA